MSFALEIKEQIRQRVNLIDVAKAYMDLRPAGRTLKALCPWHPDSNPSLTFNPERQTYKCWVCGEGGDIFSFVQKIEGVGFVEAVKLLAERAGIAWQETARPRSGGSRDGAPFDERKRLFQILAWAEQQYHECLLQSDLAGIAREYLADRGITEASWTRFKLGYAPPQFDWLTKRASAAGHSPAFLEKVGLVAARERGSGVYDRFRGRVMFPIRDVQGRTIAFGGRIMPQFAEQNPAKYVNSPETPLFSKSAHLYGLDLARLAVQRARTALVMEGYTDVVIAQQCGVDHAVAVLGTALTERHVQLLRRFCDRIVLLLDGDDAGKRRANDLLQQFIAEPIDLRILTLPDELDPADYLLEYGPEPLRMLLQDAPDALEHRFRTLTEGLDPRVDTHQIGKVVDELLGLVSKAPRLSESTSAQRMLREQQIVHRLAVRTGLAEDDLRRRLAELRRDGAKPKPMALRRVEDDRAPDETPAPAEPISPYERELFEVLLQNGEFWPPIQAAGAHRPVRNALLRRVLEACHRMHLAGQVPTLERLFDEFDEPRVKTLLVDLDESGREKAARAQIDPETRLKGLLAKAEDLRRAAEAQRLQRQIASRELGEQEELDVLSKLIAQRRKKPGSD